MQTDLIKEYGVFPSPALQEILKTEECKKFSLSQLKYVLAVFENIKRRIPENAGEIMRLDEQLTSVALHSAFLDLWRDAQFHELKNGPSFARRGAAVTCWLNRRCPIQITSRCDMEVFVFANAILALEVGWAIKANSMAGGTEPPENTCNRIREVMAETDIDNIILYPLIWRSPSYHDLIPVFELL